MEELCFSLDIFPTYQLTLQTTVLHRTDISGALEADLQDTLATEINMLLRQRLGKKRGLRKPEPNLRHLSCSCTQGG